MKRWALLVTGLCSLCAGVTAHATVAQLNLPQTFAHTQSLLANDQVANIVVLGDSLSFDGLGWSSWVPYFRQRLQGLYGDAGRGYQSFSTLTGASQFTGSWFTSGPNEDRRGSFAIDGLWASSTTAHSAVTFTATDSSIQLQYRLSPRNGSFVIRDSSGQTLATIDSAASELGLGIFEHTFAGSDRTLRIETLDDNLVTLLGVNNLPTADAGVRVHRASNSGYRLVSYLQRDPTFDSQLASLDPNLVILAIGQNDGGIPQADYLRLYDDLVQRILEAAPQTDILLVGSYNSGSGHLPELISWQAQVAAARGVGFLNLYDTAGTRWFWPSHGYLYYDWVHFSPAGANYVGNFIADVLLSDGHSLYPWKKGDMNGDGTVNLSDINPFQLALTDPEAFDATYLQVWADRSGDMNADGHLSLSDIPGFKQILAAAPAIVPEPTGLGLLALGLLSFGLRRRPAVGRKRISASRSTALGMGLVVGLLAWPASAGLSPNLLYGGDFEDLSALKLRETAYGHEYSAFNAATDLSRWVAAKSISAHDDPYAAWLEFVMPVPAPMNRTRVAGNGVLENVSWASGWGQWVPAPAHLTTGQATIDFDYLWRVWAGDDDIRDWFNHDAPVPESLALRVYGAQSLPGEGQAVGSSLSGFLDPLNPSAPTAAGADLLYEISWDKAQGDPGLNAWLHQSAAFAVTEAYAYFAVVGYSQVYGQEQIGWYESDMVISYLANAVDNIALRVPLSITPGDFNGDGTVTLSDVNPFKLALTDVQSLYLQYPDLDLPAADPDGDGQITLSDIPVFKSLLAGSSQPAVVPEPAAASLLLLSALGVACRRNR
ncbi:MAG: PEP-CTERM sorting domain-containing protein [Phycisphaeraceae bacterium]|nr:PEP-CTERM sorting domain-containing protein [Phycisphaeraceae bacterium]